MKDLEHLAQLIRDKTAIESRISEIVGRPALIGHVGEYIASRLFSIDLHQSATTKGSDGLFRNAPLTGKTVNVKWYGRLEFVLDINPLGVPDYFLVLCGPRGSVASRGGVRPWLIDAVYLFDAPPLVESLRAIGVKIGVATSVRSATWDAAEIYPAANNLSLVLNETQRRALSLFGTSWERPEITCYNTPTVRG